ncbi:hypothetical protein BDZ85DRAFT_262508 [Elsinoe ampelina]|uniref:Glycosyl transferase CAP10 domain-containing protein n=1 Tax=Elsinoe ampelina TaxID=302913 RepID=A0A6A6GAS9_9PEZI|nr:hypothetical protein BDZ85DRAFT_262508 [Elsinoe ampelina]
MAISPNDFRPQLLGRVRPPVVFFLLLVIIAGFWAARSSHVSSVTDGRFGLQGVKAIAASWQGKAVKGMPLLNGAVYDEDVTDPEWHPIKVLHEAALAKYHEMLNRQSKTLEEAVEEYIRRYGRNPPPGFDEWYQFAKGRNSRIIDDYDLLNENMEPFWRVKPEVLREAPGKLIGGDWLWRLTIKDGQAIDGEWMGDEIRSLLAEVLPSIPDLDILLNPLDEPRIVAPKDAEMDSLDDFRWIETSQQPAWDVISAPCEATGPSRPKKDDVNTHGLPFILDRASGMDICLNPALALQHGFFISPTHLITTDSPLPILSQAAPSTFGDILAPSFAYWAPNFAYDESFDIPWKEKSTKLYWAGSTTGLYNGPPLNSSSPPTESHRHRLISLTHNLNPHRSYVYLTRPTRSATWTRYLSSEPMVALYNTTFTNIVQCEPETCDFIEDYYGLGPHQDQHRSLRYKFQMDLDGNSFSGRFYRLLGSRSCPLKMTVFREWHDDRLVPWVHYVPISVGMEELPETMRYLGLTEEGERIAHSIAEAGREAFANTIRKEDMAVYLFRLFLEFARVSSDEREGEVGGRVLY